ncbi:unnamed protein product [Cuscuta europaea]|uniref:Uncharacterized protein n=1 Tax=Cuscuta europaea TaxID=41803 RepID=A0A9P1EFF5_CUSEU|nr:unnamed protein product [Cuscuta europaea]
MAPFTQVQPMQSSNIPAIHFGSTSFDSGSSSSRPQVSSLTASTPMSPLAASLAQRISTIPPLDSYRLFNMPKPFSWTPTTTLEPPPVFAPPLALGASQAVFSGPTLSGHVGVQSMPTDNSHPSQVCLSVRSRYLLWHHI